MRYIYCASHKPQIMTTAKGKVAIIGSGLIGKSWAMVFVSGGFPVCLYDIEAQQTNAALTFIREKLNQLNENGLLRGSIPVEKQISLISTTNTLKECLKDAVYIKECTPEILQIKTQVFMELGELATEGVVIASSSSAMPPSLFTRNMQKRNQALVTHPINPPYFVPLVELVPAPWTDSEIVEKCRDMMQCVGQVPVSLKKEVQGFAVVRTQNALIQQGMRLVVDGIISVEDLDKIMHNGLGIQWAFLGPFLTEHLNHHNGFQDCIGQSADAIYKISMESGDAVTMDPAAPSTEMFQKELCEYSPIETLVQRRAWRDKRVAALSLLKQNANQEQ